jgi:predicted TIM-barrel fold metal-dependent hydrolase
MAMILNDGHCHFLSRRCFEALGREKYGHEAAISLEGIASEIGCDVPAESDALADLWCAELDRQHVTRAALIASTPGDEDSVAVAVSEHPDRFVGFFMLNPVATGSRERVERAFAELGLRCACLFPALHRYELDTPAVTAVFETAAKHHAAVFVHCGYLSIESRTRLKLPIRLDLRRGDPLTLAAVAAEFPTVPVIIPHFGAGFLREALMAADVCPNIYLDTSSSNSWIKYVPGLNLTEVFRRALNVVGPDRLIFGTDSSLFPPGWRRVIYGAQRTALDELGIEKQSITKIFGENFEKIFPASGG